MLTNPRPWIVPEIQANAGATGQVRYSILFFRIDSRNARSFEKCLGNTNRVAYTT